MSAVAERNITPQNYWQILGKPPPVVGKPDPSWIPPGFNLTTLNQPEEEGIGIYPPELPYAGLPPENVAYQIVRAFESGDPFTATLDVAALPAHLELTLNGEPCPQTGCSQTQVFQTGPDGIRVITDSLGLKTGSVPVAKVTASADFPSGGGSHRAVSTFMFPASMEDGYEPDATLDQASQLPMPTKGTSQQDHIFHPGDGIDMVKLTGLVIGKTYRVTVSADDPTKLDPGLSLVISDPVSKRVVAMYDHDDINPKGCRETGGTGRDCQVAFSFTPPEYLADMDVSLAIFYFKKDDELAAVPYRLTITEPPYREYIPMVGH